MCAQLHGRRLLAPGFIFVQGQHTDALGRYAMALSYINDDFMVQLHGPHADKAGAVKQAIHLNMAACQLKLQDWQGAAWNCSQVLLLAVSTVGHAGSVCARAANDLDPCHQLPACKGVSCIGHFHMSTELYQVCVALAQDVTATTSVARFTLDVQF